MSQTERLYRIEQLLNEHGVMSFAALQARLEVSRATLRRDLTKMRDAFNAPIVYDAEAGGYRFDQPGVGPRYRLPGLWFNADEVLALMTMYQMLGDLDTGGLLGPQIKPLMTRLATLLDAHESSAKEVLARVKLLPAQRRRMKLEWFELVGAALVKRRRVRITYYTRSRKETSVRDVSPLRLIHYRNNWYLDGYCHLTASVRVFALDAIRQAELLDTAAHEVPLAEVDATVAGGYGIYRGAEMKWAVLRFNVAAAVWVKDEVWHEQQEGTLHDDGSFELRLPYTETPELVMDILRHGENVEVVEPAALRKTVIERLRAAAKRYDGA